MSLCSAGVAEGGDVAKGGNFAAASSNRKRAVSVVADAKASWFYRELTVERREEGLAIGPRMSLCDMSTDSYGMTREEGLAIRVRMSLLSYATCQEVLRRDARETRLGYMQWDVTAWHDSTRQTDLLQ